MKSLSDITSGAESSGTNSGSDSGSSSSGEYSDVREAVEAVGGSVDGAIEYIENNGAKDKLMDFVQRLDGNDELQAQMETYRRWNDIHRINQFHLRSADADYTDFTGQFYGSTDDEAGADTYNGVQKETREMGGNLAFYKALFPEPQESFWDDEPVLWQERSNEDSHIYVEESWAQEMAPFAITIEGQERPVPPSNSELDALDDGGNGGSSSSDGAFTDSGLLKVQELTVDEIKDAVKAMDDPENLRKSLNLERNQQDRKTAKAKIERQLEKVEAGDAERADPDYECSNCDFATNDIEKLAEHEC